MDTRSAGGVLLAFAGIVLLIAGFRGTLGNVKNALLSAPSTPPTPGGALPPAPLDALNPGINDAHPGLSGGQPLTATPPVTGLGWLPAGYAGTGNVSAAPFPQFIPVAR